MFNRLKNDSFRQNVTTLVSGTAIAQAIPIAISPILTRLYTPEDFGILALYAAIAFILTNMSTAQYEMAITLPADDEDAARMLSLTIRVCSIFSIVLFLLVAIFNHRVAAFFGHPEIANWLYLVPLTVVFSASFSAYSLWCVRRSAYKQIAKQGVQLSFVTGFCSIAFGLANIAGGQILAILTGRILAVASLSRFVRKTDKSILQRAKGTPLNPIAKRYIAHPTYFMPARLMEDFALQIPVFMISSIFLISTVGFFSLAYRLVSLPIALISNAIGNVYRQQISESYNQHGEFRSLFLKTLVTTILIGILPFSILYWIAPSLFGFVFGEEWRVAGEYAQIIVVSTFFSFVTTPLNKGAIIVGAKKYVLIWNVALLVGYLMVWVLAHSLSLQIEQVLWCVALVSACLYLIDVCFQYRFSLGSPQGKRG